MKLVRPDGYEKMLPILIVLVVLLAASNLFTIFWLKQSLQPKTQTQNQNYNVVDNKDLAQYDRDNDGLTDDKELLYKTNPLLADTDGDGFTDKQEIDSGHDPLVADVKIVPPVNSTSSELTVEWEKTPVKVSGEEVFKPGEIDAAIEKFSLAQYVESDCAKGQKAAECIKIIKNLRNDFDKGLDIVRVGKVVSGKYVDSDVLVMKYFSSPYEMGTGVNGARVISGKNLPKNIILEAQSEKFGLIGENLFDRDASSTITNLEPAEKIAIPNSKINLVRIQKTSNLLNQSQNIRFLSDLSNVESLFKYDGDKYVYKYIQYQGGCFLVLANDGTVREYFFDDPIFAGYNKKFERYYEGEVFQLNIAGKLIEKHYIVAKMTGCGPQGCYSYPEYIKSKNQLEIVGTFSNGDSIYELKDEKITTDINITSAETKRVSVLKNAYDSYFPGYDEKTQKQKSKKSYATFLADHPLIYWQDPFGGFVELVNVDYMQMVECGKPVIYLYPIKTTTVSVKVTPNGGFSKTEPEYGQGWNVVAEPNGQLKNIADNKAYPYLFWEGRGLNYVRPTEGFVVKKNEVNQFLSDKLALLGMNKKEIADFKEFWLPRMQAKPYYFVSFVPKEQFDQLAPLKVEPKPDTVIRVFMDYEALDAPMKNIEPKLITPVRRGFTVVEWGGALR
ncbi:MAG: hypothetical protein WCK11_01655 [Candidatus Falkowbacteria bacterium]